MHKMRINRMVKWLEDEKLDALFIDNPIDLFYLTGLHLSVGRLVISLNQTTLLVDGRYFETAKKQNHCEVQLNSEAALAQVLNEKKVIGFDSSFMTVNRWQRVQEQLPDKQWSPIDSPLKNFRMIKDEMEIAALKKAGELTFEGIQHIISKLKEGVSEEELALEFEIFCKKRGASQLSFSPIIAFGENSAYPHYRAGKTKLQKNQIVLIDVGAVVDEYRGDMSRTLFFGKAEPKLHYFFLCVERAKQKAISIIRPGIAFGQLDQVARESLHQDGLGDFFTHGLSHGIGLETHEFPSLRIKGGDHHLMLEPGMVFSVEPGVYCPGLGGVRIEDIVHVTKEGAENFCKETSPL